VINIQRKTIQRQIIFDVLRSLEHPTVSQINDVIQKEHPAISKSTIYRNLRQMEDEKLVCRIWLPNDTERYDNNTTPHYHLKCTSCGTIYDIEPDTIEQKTKNPTNTATISTISTIVAKAIKKRYNFAVTKKDLVFSGTCGEC